MRKGSKAQRKLTNGHRKQLIEVITTKLPDEVGFPSKEITILILYDGKIKNITSLSQ